MTAGAGAAELQLTSAPSRDTRVARRWSLPSPRGLAIFDNILYVGLSERQSIAAIDPATGVVRLERVLDSADIASTKELLTLRVDAPRKRLIVANGSDESVTILSLPDLNVLREITLEGESIRDAIPDPKGRFLYILGRSVHVWDGEGKREITTISSPDPMAIAVSASSGVLAIVGSEIFDSGKATVVALFDAGSLKETAREPLQTDRTIQAALFAAEDQSLIVVARDWLAEKSLVPRKEKAMPALAPRITVGFGDLISSDTICLADSSGPQIITAGKGTREVHYIERRCGESGSFTASHRKVAASSIYGVKGWAAAYDASSGLLWVTDPAGQLTAYKSPPGERGR